MTEREEITSVKFMNCSNFQRLYPATSLPSPHLPTRKMSKYVIQGVWLATRARGRSGGE